MKFKIIYKLLFILFCNVLVAQQNQLIFETDSIAIYDTYLSLNSKENISPVPYKNGIIYTSMDTHGINKLYFSDLKSKIQKVKINSSDGLRLVAIYNDEIYFTRNGLKPEGQSVFDLSIFKGEIENFKVKKYNKLSICKPQFTYEYPTISKDGNQMVLVTNERGLFHLLELKRNDKNTWEKSDVIFISNANYSIINPTIYDENTIYFSSNITEAKVNSVEYALENGSPIINNVYYDVGDFNIYKIVKTGVSWGLPQKVSVLNSEFDDLSVFFLTEKTGYLTTLRYDDTYNIYYFELKQ